MSSDVTDNVRVGETATWDEPRAVEEEPVAWDRPTTGLEGTVVRDEPRTGGTTGRAIGGASTRSAGAAGSVVYGGVAGRSLGPAVWTVTRGWSSLESLLSSTRKRS